jgi:hypothetical protein
MPDATLGIPQLKAKYRSLCIPANSKERVALEQQKLTLIKAIDNKIRTEVSLRPTVANQEPPAPSKLKKMSWKALYYFLLLFGLFEDTAGSYLASTALLALLPGLFNPFIMITSILYTVLGCILFYAYEVSFLKDALGIPYTNSNAHQLLVTYSEQLKAIKTINQHITSVPIITIDDEEYDNYLQLVALLNQDLQIKYNAMDSYQESTAKKILKFGVLAFGALSSITGSYFMATYLLALMSTALIGTPVGWGIVVLAIIAGFGFSYVMGNRGLARLFNPDYNNFKELKKELRLFQEEYPPQLEQAKAIKDRFKVKVMHDAETQTLPSPVSHPGIGFFDHGRTSPPPAATPFDLTPANSSAMTSR